jgi:Tol biopolymer transport system component
VYAATTDGPTYLWRVDVDGRRAPERLEVAGPHATEPAIASSRDRMAFSRGLGDTDIYRFESGRPAQPVLGSTFQDAQPHLSPDGHRLVFTTVRFNAIEIWVAQADGSSPHQLTHGPGTVQASPVWSPDGQQIAFDSLGEDLHHHIWLVDADGGTPRRLTTDEGTQGMPTWSRDGRWIYYSSDSGIWRIPASGGTPQRLTPGASGPFACESTDGRTLLFQPKDADSPLMAMPIGGGASRQLVPCVRNGAFGAGPEGVYYVACDGGSDPPIYAVNVDTGKSRRLGTLESPRSRPNGLSVSRDGKTIVYSKITSQDADIMLLEHFR